MGFVGVVLAALGGLWVPVEVFPETMRTIAYGMPSYWYAEMGRNVAAGGAPSGQAVLVLAGFTTAFAVLAVLVARRRPLYAVAG
jgi:ABC-2 type transport system permease protein